MFVHNMASFLIFLAIKSDDFFRIICLLEKLEAIYAKTQVCTFTVLLNNTQNLKFLMISVFLPTLSLYDIFLKLSCEFQMFTVIMIISLLWLTMTIIIV